MTGTRWRVIVYRWLSDRKAEAVATRQKNGRELLFERYLAQWGYGDYEHQPDWLNPPKRPDYLIRTASGEVAAEVKSFESWGLLETLEDGPFAMQTVTKTLKPVRDRISKAAGQLKGITGRPLVVVLDNPGNRMPLSPPNVIFAMYGDPEFIFPADPGQPGFWHAGLNGELHLVNERGIEHGNHAHLSAIAILRERSVDAGSTVVTLDVFETISDQCVPLPATVFVHEGDTRWGVLGPGQYGLRSGVMR
jgi:hypothetical protein